MVSQGDDYMLFSSLDTRRMNSLASKRGARTVDVHGQDPRPPKINPMHVKDVKIVEQRSEPMLGLFVRLESQMARSRSKYDNRAGDIAASE